MTKRARFWTAAAVVVAGIALAGCPHRVGNVDVATLTDDVVTARLMQSAARRQTMQAVLKARLPGLQGVVVNATIDAAARAPADLNVAVRSFFEVPQQVLVANGGEVTLYDATSGEPRFYRGPANDRTLQRVLGLPLAPDDAVALLLGRPPVDTRPGWPAPRVRLVGVDEERGTYRAKIERPGRGAVVVDVNADDDALVSATMFRGDGRMLVTATFDKMENEDGAVPVAYARRIRLLVHEGGQEVVLDVQQATFNEPILDEAFVLVPPEGMSISPL